MASSIRKTSVALAAIVTAVTMASVGVVAPATAAATGAACEAPAPGQGRFGWAQGTTYTDESASEAARTYHLTGCTPYDADDLAPMGLSGDATLLVAYKGQEIGLGATGLQLDGAGGYFWTFPSSSQQDGGAISSITGADGADITLRVRSRDGADRESADLRFTLADPGAFDPDAVRIRTVIFTETDAPYIDVFHRVGHAITS